MNADGVSERERPWFESRPPHCGTSTRRAGDRRSDRLSYHSSIDADSDTHADTDTDTHTHTHADTDGHLLSRAPVIGGVSGDPAFTLLGWPASEPTLRLDYREFAYAGKFVVSGTGKAVLHAPEADLRRGRDADECARGVLAAVAFDADRTDSDRAVLRYVTVRTDRQGEGLGPLLVERLLDRIAAEGRYDRARIAVNNPYAYVALHRAGFAYAGEATGIAELVLERPVGRPATVDADRYRAGLDRFRERDSTAEERALIERERAAGPPGSSERDERDRR